MCCWLFLLLPLSIQGVEEGDGEEIGGASPILMTNIGGNHDDNNNKAFCINTIESLSQKMTSRST